MLPQELLPAWKAQLYHDRKDVEPFPCAVCYYQGFPQMDLNRMQGLGLGVLVICTVPQIHQHVVAALFEGLSCCFGIRDAMLAEVSQCSLPVWISTPAA
jgi:hypothetical protein